MLIRTQQHRPSRLDGTDMRIAFQDVSLVDGGPANAAIRRNSAHADSPAAPGSRRPLPFLLAFAAILGAATAQLEIDNFKDGEVVRQHAILVRGSCKDPGPVEVTDPDGTVLYRAPVSGGRFAAVLGTRPGRSQFSFRAGKASATLSVVHEPATSRRRLRIVHAIAADGSTAYPTQRADDPQDHRAKLGTAAMLLQAFTAESLRDAGYGRSTFQLETNDSGNVVIHDMRHPESLASLQKLEGNAIWSAMWSFVGRNFDPGIDRVMVVTGFSGYDAKRKKALAHTALGGGHVGVFSNLCIHSWPNSLADIPRAFTDDTPVDTSKVYEDVGLKDLRHLASTTIGAVMHEIGHTFELPHTADPTCVMSRGFDHFHRVFVPPEPTVDNPVRGDAVVVTRWSPAFALRLAHSPWFQADDLPQPDAAGPTFTRSDSGKKVTLHVPAGVAGWSVHSGGKDLTAAHAERVDDPKLTRLSVDFNQMRRAHRMKGKLTLIAFDRAHRMLCVDEEEAQ